MGARAPECVETTRLIGLEHDDAVHLGVDGMLGESRSGEMWVRQSLIRRGVRCRAHLGLRASVLAGAPPHR